MKLQPDRSDLTLISGYGPGWVSVGTERFTHSLIVNPFAPPQPWACTGFADLGAAHFVALAAHDMELLLLGSGTRLRFAPPAWLAPLMEKRIGVETMDTLAACRTYNILAAEGRRVWCALLLEPASLSV